MTSDDHQSQASFDVQEEVNLHFPNGEHYQRVSPKPEKSHSLAYRELPGTSMPGGNEILCPV